ncbi:DUF3160 domain-containing protein [Moorena sp. SIO4A5]|uniref:DUF3160 domain-containing protein n=1 Tax=Moorena sp. SIO4A5 TaxID=2607838 RepID=UPI0013C78FE4|nr:DUF3160 domain-containing protein [Moorena sp. SIO4A5]NEO21090.1 DUF3160 domain-containing protein [Moorena sp. SIO4A5]
MKHFKKSKKLILSFLVALFIIVSNQPFLINSINGSDFFAKRAFAQTTSDTFGYNAAFEEEWNKIGQMSTEKFAQRYDANADYIQGISWDPTTAKYWDLFNRDPKKHEQLYYDFRLNQDELSVFNKNGFVVSERLGTKSFARMFYRIYSNDLPVFVSADSILHAWHMSYDAMLKELEEKVLAPSLEKILQGMAETIPVAAKEYGNGELESSLKDVDYFLAVARSLLKPNSAKQSKNKRLQIIVGKSNNEASPESDLADEPVKTYLNQDERVAETLNFVKAQQLQGFKLFGRERRVDFSQFKPRGHYENSERLRKYFQAMMWCGRIDFRIAGKPEEASPRELGAAIIFHDLLKKSGNFELWQQFDEIIQTFVGWTDSMTFAQLDKLLVQAQINSPANVNSRSSLEQLQNTILDGKFGIQNIRGHYHLLFKEEKPQLPRSFTILGQKFVLDSWVMSQVVDVSKIWDGTFIKQNRPTALDVAFAALDNNQVTPNLVERITNLEKQQPKVGLNYQNNLAAAKNVIDQQDPSVWKDNIYMNWLATLRELSVPTSNSKYPEAMRTQPWAMKTLNTQLASWTQLRHDTILYAKQSYGIFLACEYPAGFVEPRPEFWERFEQMVRLTAQQLKKTPLESQEIQTKQVKFLEQFAQKLGIIKEIASKELAQQPLTKVETKFLKDIVEIIQRASGSPKYEGWYPKLFYSNPKDSDKWDALVADVHTSIGEREPDIVLHEGVGNVDMLMIAVENGDDRMVFAGPVMSHYEFEVPSVMRKSDSEWKQDIQNKNIPPRPDWTKDYLVSPLSVQTSIGQQPSYKALQLQKEALQYLDQGQFQAAMSNYEQVLSLTRELKDTAWEAKILYSMAVEYTNREQYQQALELYQQALPLTQKIGDRTIESIILSNMGRIHAELAQYSQALEFFDKSSDVSQQIGNRVTQGRSINSIQAIQSSLEGNHQKALELFQQALDINRKIGDKRGEIFSLTNIASIYGDQGEYQKALKLYNQVFDISLKIGDCEGIAVSLNDSGLIYYELGDKQQALELYRKALDFCEKYGFYSDKAKTMLNIGKAYSGMEQFQEALHFYQQALAIFQELKLSDDQANALAHIGSTFMSMGKLNKAKATLYQAIDLIESVIRPNKDLHKISMFENKVFPYKALQYVLIQQNEREKALEVSERGRTRAFVELLAKRLAVNSEEIADFKPISLKQIRQIAVEQNSTLVEYSILPSNSKEFKLYSWVILPTGKIEFRAVDLPQETSLEKLVSNGYFCILQDECRSGANQTLPTVGDWVKLKDDQFDQPWQVVDIQQDTLKLRLENWEEDTTIPRPITDVVAIVKAFNRKSLQQLHELLIKPIADLLPKNENDRVIFIPHQQLFLVPFPALQDKDGNYLIQRHTILTAPSIEVLGLTHKKRKQLPNSVQGAVVVGNPTMPRVTTKPGEKPEQLPELPHAQEEAIKIAELLNTQALTGKSATKAAILPKLLQARIIHLATHGLLSDFKGLGIPGAIALAPSGTGEINDGLLTAGELLQMKLNAELVVLSACKTGQGDITSDGVIGLSRSLVAAGVPSIIVSLWSVPDAPTADLMKEFYQNLDSTGDKAQALRQAMLTMIPKFPNPKDWAAFTLIGEAN